MELRKNGLKTLPAALPVMEHFYTIQGEGFHQGRAAYFIRLGGCDVGCVWCDVKESWEAEKHPTVPNETLLTAIKQTPAEIAVITGGEPLMYDLEKLTTDLKAAGLKTHLETSGAYPLTGHWDWICFSPKKFKSPVMEICNRADELKVVVFNQHDLKWAEIFEKLVSPACRLFLQPEWGKATEITPLVIDYIKHNPQWEISLQIHKYINVP